MKPDPLEACLRYIELPQAVMSGADVARWPVDQIAVLRDSGILRVGSPSFEIFCPACRGDDPEEVIVAQPGAPLRLACRTCGVIEIDQRDCETWSLDRSALAKLLRKTLLITQGEFRGTANWLWHLGRMKWGSTTRAAVLVCGYHPDTGYDIAKALGRGSQAVVFVPVNTRAAEPLRTRGLAIVSSAEVLRIHGGTIEIDGALLKHIVAEQDRASKYSLDTVIPALVQKVQKEQSRNGQDRTERDLLIANAYAIRGSYSKAALLVSEWLNVKVTKRQVADAMKRLGGLAKVQGAIALASVNRRVNSRDGADRDFLADLRKCLEESDL